MKLIASNIGGSIEDYKTLQSNCYYDKDKCKQYFIPISVEKSKDLYWYLALAKKPKKVTHYIIDTCSGAYYTRRPRFYVYGQNTDGNYYGVLNGYNSIQYDVFTIAVKVIYEDNTFQYFFSETYEIEKCLPFDIVYSCYNKADNGGYDANGIYVGLPTLAIIGNSEVRYYHNYTARDLRFIVNGRKITYTALNYTPVKSIQERTAELYSEPVPYWYENYIAQAFAKGIVVLDGYQYTITDYAATLIGAPCCERLNVIATATKTTKITYTCSTDTCITLQCSLPPSVESTTVKICLSDATFSKQIKVNGTAPISVEVIENGGFTIEFNELTNYLTISSTPPKIGTIQLLISNCDGDVTTTINVTEGGCCNLGTLELLNYEGCTLGTLTLEGLAIIAIDDTIVGYGYETAINGADVALKDLDGNTFAYIYSSPTGAATNAIIDTDNTILGYGF